MHLLAINWYPEIRGITVVLIMFLTLAGSVYLLLGTNLGARLGLLTALAGLFAWMTLMGAMWFTYGIGLKGKDPSWKAQQIFLGADELATNPVSRGLVPQDKDLKGGWTKLPDDNPGRGQAASSSDEVLLNEAKRLGFTSTGDYTTVAVYDKGGKRWPRLGPYHPNIWFVKKVDVDFLAFRHDPHYVLVQVQPNIAKNTEPGKAPPKAEVDPTKTTIFVLMERDLGYHRLPAATVMVGSGMIFLILVLMLHSRDKRSMTARAGSGALVRV